MLYKNIMECGRKMLHGRTVLFLSLTLLLMLTYVLLPQA